MINSTLNWGLYTVCIASVRLFLKIFFACVITKSFENQIYTFFSLSSILIIHALDKNATIFLWSCCVDNCKITCVRKSLRYCFFSESYCSTISSSIVFMLFSVNNYCLARTTYSTWCSLFISQDTGFV